jgi:hypothetical protein
VQEKSVLTGSFKSGFYPRPGAFRPLNAYIETIAPVSPSGTLPLVLFVSDPRASTADYLPFLTLLAQEGFEIKAAEFFTSDNRRFRSLLNVRPLRKFASRMYYLFAREDFDSTVPAWNAAAAEEYSMLMEYYGITAAAEGRAVYLLSDSNDAALGIVAQRFSPLPTGYLAVTPGPHGGFGCIEQTDPIMARFFGAGRDTEFSAPQKALAQWNARFSPPAN